jgi:putative transposase
METIMSYWQTFYHIVWSTKRREPLIIPEVESQIYGFIRNKAIGLGGIVFALNGMPDHVHLVASIPPALAVSTFIGQVKGVASTKFNKLGMQGIPLFWQEEYGVFTLDHKRLPNLIAYVENQKIHHAQNGIIPVLERSEGEGMRLIREATYPYTLNEDDWRREMLELD